VGADESVAQYRTLAQLVEQSVDNAQVAGSSPARPTIFLIRPSSTTGRCAALKMRMLSVRIRPWPPYPHVAQLDRALGYEPRGWKFKPSRAGHTYVALSEGLGARLQPSLRWFKSTTRLHVRVAQTGHEQAAFNRKAVGTQSTLRTISLYETSGSKRKLHTNRRPGQTLTGPWASSTTG
jgi:hypothetical protein